MTLAPALPPRPRNIHAAIAFYQSDGNRSTRSDGNGSGRPAGWEGSPDPKYPVDATRAPVLDAGSNVSVKGGNLDVAPPAVAEISASIQARVNSRTNRLWARRIQDLNVPGVGNDGY